MKLGSQKKEKNSKVLTANEETNVKDIRNGFIYTKDHYIIGFLKLASINIDLLSSAEKESTCDMLTAEFKGEKEPFSILVIPRTVDIELYINNLSSKYEDEIQDINKKMLLNEMIREGTHKIMDGQNYEHQFYLQIWKKCKTNKNIEQVEMELKERLHNFEKRYNTIKNDATYLTDSELIRLCNLFANSNHAMFETYENDDMYIPIPQLAKGRI